jgi:uncharacterized protein (DUF169 family)
MYRNLTALRGSGASAKKTGKVRIVIYEETSRKLMGHAEPDMALDSP